MRNYDESMQNTRHGCACSQLFLYFYLGISL